MSDNVFVVNKYGSYRMLLSQQWFLEANKRGLRDPWAHRPDRPIRYEKIMMAFGDKEVPAEKPIYNEYTEEEVSAWKAERDEYMRQRDEWIALQMFNKYGYEQFCLECNAYSLTEEFFKSVRPCESHSDSQCNLFCPIYKDCRIRLN